MLNTEIANTFYSLINVLLTPSADNFLSYVQLMEMKISNQALEIRKILMGIKGKAITELITWERRARDDNISE